MPSLSLMKLRVTTRKRKTASAENNNQVRAVKTLNNHLHQKAVWQGQKIRQIKETKSLSLMARNNT